MSWCWLESADRTWLKACRWAGICICVLLGVTSCRRGWEPQAPASPEEMKTADLKQTSIVATLDSAVPDHKSAIWCATLQLAWNKLKDDIVRDPISIVGADSLSNALNHPSVSADDLDVTSFYADAGLVSDGILERIREQMARRFPAEPRPIFSDRYTQPLPTIVAYSYLYVNIPFTHAFSNQSVAFTFRQSDGESVETTAFCSVPQAARDQIDVLNYDSPGGFERTEFAVDLCKDTNPYQIVLARIPRPGSLSEAVASVEQKIAQFKQKPDYNDERRMRQEDSLIVPDLLFKLEHHFSELEGKSLGNRRFEDYSLFEVVQTIDFGLSRTGLVLKSKARLGAVRGGLPRRYFHFDKPFLIYVKRRAGASRPFFVMWVDNAELMKKWPGIRQTGGHTYTFHNLSRGRGSSI
jgi:hypothetical protein